MVVNTSFILSLSKGKVSSSFGEWKRSSSLSIKQLDTVLDVLRDQPGKWVFEMFFSRLRSKIRTQFLGRTPDFGELGLFIQSVDVDSINVNHR